MRIVTRILLGLVIIVLGYLCFQSIYRPLTFTDVIKKQRYEAIANRLKNIRTAQVAFKEVNGQYTGSFDTLINFIKNDSLPLIKSIGSLTDEQVEAGMTEKEAVKKGFITRDTVMVPVFQTIFNDPKVPKPTNAEDMRYVPFTGKKFTFDLAAGEVVTGSSLKVKVFEAKVSNMKIFDDIYNEFEEEILQENGNRIRLGKYPGLKVGSLEEANNNAGNWE
ncbi:MAG: hypothetical protein N4A49_06900 [Marinifilaceae bacterium]|jgi:hypothetical protein|nr:hypothetical protein [Marinifilaceae bacterium]